MNGAYENNNRKKHTGLICNLEVLRNEGAEQAGLTDQKASRTNVW